jgi:hypothetical protein
MASTDAAASWAEDAIATEHSKILAAMPPEGQMARPTLVARVLAAIPASTMSLDRAVACACAIHRASAVLDEQYRGVSIQLVDLLFSSSDRQPATRAFFSSTLDHKSGSPETDERIAALLPSLHPNAMVAVAAVIRREAKLRAAERSVPALSELERCLSVLPATAKKFRWLTTRINAQPVAKLFSCIGPALFRLERDTEEAPPAVFIGKARAETLLADLARVSAASPCARLVDELERLAKHRGESLLLQWSEERMASYGWKLGRLDSRLEALRFPNMATLGWVTPRAFAAALAFVARADKLAWSVAVGDLTSADPTVMHPVGLALALDKLRKFLSFTSSGRCHPSLYRAVQESLPATSAHFGLTGKDRSSAALAVEEDTTTGMKWVDLSTVDRERETKGEMAFPSEFRVGYVLDATSANAAADVLAGADVVGIDCEWVPQILPLPPMTGDLVISTIEARCAEVTGPLPPRKRLPLVEACEELGIWSEQKQPVSTVQLSTDKVAFVVNPLSVLRSGRDGSGVAAMTRLLRTITHGGAGQVLVGLGISQDYSLLRSTVLEFSGDSSAMPSIRSMPVMSPPTAEGKDRPGQLPKHEEDFADLETGREDDDMSTLVASSHAVDTTVSDAASVAQAVDDVVVGEDASDLRALVDLQDTGWSRSIRGAAPSRGAQASLSDLAEAGLGRPLNKQEKLSNWDAQPHSAEQLHYAAMDAYACVALWALVKPSG